MASEGLNYKAGRRLVNLPNTVSQTTGDDTIAMNPSATTKWGYRINSGFAGIGKKVISVTFYLNNSYTDYTPAGTGMLSCWIGSDTSVGDNNTQIGKFNAESIPAATSGGTACKFQGGTKILQVNDIIWLQNNDNRSGNTNAYMKASGGSNYTFWSNTTTCYGTALNSRPPGVQSSGTAYPFKIDVEYEDAVPSTAGTNESLSSLIDAVAEKQVLNLGGWIQ